MRTKETPISGSTSACLEHFSQNHPGQTIVDELSKFIGVKPKTAMEWLTGVRLPKGPELIKLRAFLVQLGYDVKEFSSMPEDNQKFCLMVGFSVLGVEEVKQHLNYKDQQGVLDLALRGRHVMKVRANDFDRLLRQNGERLDEAVQAFLAQAESVLGGSTPSPSPVRSEPIRHEHITPDDDHRLVVALAHNLHTASWLAEIVASWGDNGRELLGGILSDREFDLIISRIEKLRARASGASSERSSS